MKKIVRVALAALGLFIVSIVFFLHLNGMVTAKPPFLVASVPPNFVAETDSMATDSTMGNAEGDSTVVAQADDAESPDADAPVPEDTAPPPPDASGASTTTPSTTTAGSDSLAAPMSPEGATQAVAGAAAAAGDEDEVSRDEKLERLVRVYEQMRAKQVALILNTMPDDESAAILAAMKERTAAKILAGMSPEKAARMSRLLVESEGHD